MKWFLFLAMIFSGILFSGCKKDFLDSTNPNQLTVNSYYKTESEAVGAVNSVYAVLQHMNLFRQFQWLIYDGMSDDVAWASTDDEPANAMFSFNYSATMSKSNEMWRTLYSGIFRANQVIENVSSMDEFTMKNRILGEAKFLRAWYYFELVRGWGGVPRITESLKGAQTSYDFKRVSKEEIYALIKEDLEFAEQNLPKKAEYSGTDIGRATTGAASAYLGKVYLFQQNWQGALDQFQKVIGSNEYQLTAKYGDNFSAATENNTESVFEVQFTGDGTGIWDEDDSPGIGESNLLPVSYFNWVTLGPMYQFKRNELYGPPSSIRGPRYNATFGTNPAGNPRIVKYVEFNTSDFRRSDVNIRDMRYADVLLMYAEAANEIGSMDDAKGAVDEVIDRVRKEVGINDPSEFTASKELKTTPQLIEFGAIGPYNFSNDKDGIRNVIKYERRIELMYEQKRYKDLVRWGDAKAAFDEWAIDNETPRDFINGKNELFPIPDAEISGNAGISDADQNPGY